MAFSNRGKTILATFTVLILVCHLLADVAMAVGECGRTPIATAAASLTPCLGAAKNGKSKVTPPCCAKVNTLIRTAPKCLCSVLLSPVAKQAGVNPGIAITIPKRCNIKNRPVGKKCGRYVVP